MIGFARAGEGWGSKSIGVTSNAFTETLLEGTVRTEGPQTMDGVTRRYDASFRVVLPALAGQDG